MLRDPTFRHVAVTTSAGVVVHTSHCLDTVLKFRDDPWLEIETSGEAPPRVAASTRPPPLAVMLLSSAAPTRRATCATRPSHSTLTPEPGAASTASRVPRLDLALAPPPSRDVSSSAVALNVAQGVGLQAKGRPLGTPRQDRPMDLPPRRCRRLLPAQPPRRLVRTHLPPRLRSHFRVTWRLGTSLRSRTQSALNTTQRCHGLVLV